MLFLLWDAESVAMQPRVTGNRYVTELSASKKYM